LQAYDTLNIPGTCIPVVFYVWENVPKSESANTYTHTSRQWHNYTVSAPRQDKCMAPLPDPNLYWFFKQLMSMSAFSHNDIESNV